MSETNKPETKEKHRSGAGPTIVEPPVDSIANAETAIELPSVPSVQSEQSVQSDSIVNSIPAQPSLEADLRQVEAELGTTEASFARGLTDKMSYAAGPVEDALAGVVGNPYTREQQWYAACEEAGDKDLSGKPSFWKVAVFRATATVGVFFSFAAIMLCYVSSIFFAACSSQYFGLTADTFLNELVGLDYMGFIVAGAAALFFWSSFFAFFKETFRFLAAVLFFGVAFNSLQGHLFLGTPATAIFTIAYLPFLFLVGWIGGACREALPMHISSRRLAAYLMPALAFPGMAMVATFFAVTQHDYSQPTRYAPTDLNMLAFNAISIFLCTLVPGFVLARSTRSKTPVGSASLAVMLQTPLLLGLVLTLVTCLLLGGAFNAGLPAQQAFNWMKSFSAGDWAQFGGLKSLAVLGSIVLASVSAAAGGALGAWCNNKFGVKADEKPLPADLR